jgi:hypothetical protein
MLASAGYAQNVILNKDVIASGGGISTSLILRGNGTIGQSISGESASSGFSIKSGFWKGGGAGGSGCDYAVGDVNGSDNYNGLDVTYGVAFFKGGNPPECNPCAGCPDWYYCGDVNGSCSYNGVDITYGVAYLKGGSGLIPCADCSPISMVNLKSGYQSSPGKGIERQINSMGSSGKALLILESQIDGVNNELTVDVKLSAKYSPTGIWCGVNFMTGKSKPFFWDGAISAEWRIPALIQKGKGSIFFGSRLQWRKIFPWPNSILNLQSTIETEKYPWAWKMESGLSNPKSYMEKPV